MQVLGCLFCVEKSPARVTGPESEGRGHGSKCLWVEAGAIRIGRAADTMPVVVVGFVDILHGACASGVVSVDDVKGHAPVIVVAHKTDAARLCEFSTENPGFAPGCSPLYWFSLLSIKALERRHDFSSYAVYKFEETIARNIEFASSKGSHLGSTCLI